MRALTLFNTPIRLPREMDRFFERFMDFGPEAMPGEWNPKMDIAETKEAFVATVEVPGIDPAAMRVELKNAVLTIAGEKKKEETAEKDERYYRTERVYGRFERAFRLPRAVDEKTVTAAFKNGVLTVTMPKAAAAGTTIPVKAA